MKREILIVGFLDTHIFRPVLASPDATCALKRGVRFTRMCLGRLPADSMIRYFWSAIEGTGRSENFAAQMRAEGFTTFEEILETARHFFRELKSDV